MRPLRLTRAAARAEVLVLRRQAAGIVRRAVMGVVAAVFAIAVLILAHVIAYLALRQYVPLSPILAAAAVLAADALVAILFAVLASRTPTDPVLEEARRLRDQSLEQARQSLTLAAMLAPVTRIASDVGLFRTMFRLVRRLPRERV